MVIEGKLHQKGDTQSTSETFRKRDFVVEYADNPTYPQFVQFQCTQDRCSLLDSFNVGDKIEVTFNIRGREWTSPQGEKKYFNTLEAWRIQKVESDGQPQTVDDLARNSPPLPGESDDFPW